VLSLAWPESGAGYLAWFALAPFLVALEGRGARAGFGLGFVFGLGFFGALLWWITHAGFVAWVVLVFVQALFTAAFGSINAGLRLAGWWRVAAAPVLWVAIEYVRSLFPVGGFTWGQIAQSQHDLLWMLRPAALAGAWLVTFMVILVNSLIAVAFRSEDATRPVGAAAVALGVVVWPLALPVPAATGASADVAIVQGNVLRDFAGSAFDRELAIVASHTLLTRALDSSSLDLVVWPESAVGLDIERFDEVAEMVASAARAADAPLIVGGNLDVDDEHYKVMALHISDEGAIVDRYQKTHLVPFGEYVPARVYLDWIPMLDQVPRDAVAANEPVVFDVAGGKVAPVISFEGDFGSLVRERIDAGGRLLVVATNTSTWGESWASAQHVAFSQLRAAENGVWVVHAAISGISAFIAPDGQVLSATKLWTRATLAEEVRFARRPSFYSRTGDWFPLACGLGTILLFGAAIVHGKRAS
jgi:apolipoprotein N-acyltransferase